MVLKLIIIVTAAQFLLASSSPAQSAQAYIGTYTADPAAASSQSSNHGEGIYLVDIDDATGLPSNPRLVARTLSPSWLALSADYQFLYAVNEVDSFGPHGSGSVTAFAVDSASGLLRKLNTVDSGGAIPAYISVHPSGRFVMVANYTGGSFAVIRIKPDGSLGDITDVVKPSGPLNPPTAEDNPPGQFSVSDHSGSRCHMIGPDPSGQYVIGNDAGRDQIFVWTLESGTGKLDQVSVTPVLPGAAPRHFVFSHDGKTLYQVQEQDSRLQVYDFEDGRLTARGPSISVLPDGYEGSNLASEILIDKSGRHLYAANRTHNSIATFTVTDRGAALSSSVPTEGNSPRSLTLDPSGKFLYSLNQRANHIATFRIGPHGTPEFSGNWLAIGSPAVMVFRQ